MINLNTPQRSTSISTDHTKNSTNGKDSSLLMEKSHSSHNTSDITNHSSFTSSSQISSPKMSKPPSTPDKSMDIDPPPLTAPPSMKRKSTKNSSPTDSPKKPKKTSPRKSKHDEISSDPNYDKDFSLKLLDLSEKTIESTSKNHLAQILALRVKADDKLSHFQRLLQLTELQIRTRAIRVLNSLRKKPLLRISSTTRDATIKSLSMEALRATYRNINNSSDKPVDPGALSLLSTTDLISSIITHRDSLPSSRKTNTTSENANNQEPANSNTNSNTDASTAPDDIKIEESPATTTKTTIDDEEKTSPPPPMDSDMPDKSVTLPDDPSSENASATASRSGITDSHETPNSQNIGDFLNDASDTTKSVSNVKEIVMHTLSIRPKIFGDRMEGTFSEIARSFFKKIREWDDSVCIKPFNSPSKNFIYHETNIPDDLEAASTWISDTQTTAKWKYFAFQIRTTKTLQYTRGKIIKWMGEVKCFTKVDKISSAKITCLGFLDNFHPDFHNRDRVMCHIHEYLTEVLQQETYVSIFTRPIHAGKGLDRVETDAVVIEAASNEAALICDHLYSIPLDMYTEVMFVPFSKMDKSYESTLTTVLNSNSKFTQSVEELNVPNLKFFNSGATYTNKLDNMRDILMTFNTPTCEFIYDIDVNRNGGTSIIYNIEHATKAREFLETLPSILEAHMSPESVQKCLLNDINIDKLLKPTKAKLARSTLRHSRSVTKKYAKINPPSDDNTDVTSTPHSQQSYASAVSGTEQLHTMESKATPLSQAGSLTLNDELQVYIDTAVQNKLKAHLPTQTTEEAISKLVNDTVNSKFSDLAPQITQDDISDMINESVKLKLSDFDDRIIDLENVEPPEIPSTESIISAVKHDISKDMTSYNNRISAIEKTVGEHTQSSNLRLESIEDALRVQTASINKFMAAMTASNTHIPAADSNCRVVANVS